jgi:hypothetical protein
VRSKQLRTPLLIPGTLALLVGLLWIGQGTGTVNWPQSSFMIRQVRCSRFSG